MQDFGSIADWVAAVAAVVAALSSLWLMVHTLSAGRKARKEREDARLSVRSERHADNALKLTVGWEPNELARMVLLELTLLEPASAVLQKRGDQPDRNREEPWNGVLPVALIDPTAGKKMTVDFRHFLNSRSEFWSVSLYVVWSEESALERARARLRIIDEDSRKVLTARNVAITPIN